MKVLVVTTSYPMVDVPTAGIFVERLANRLAAACEVTVLAPATPGGCGNEQRDGVRLVSFRYAPRHLQILAQQPGGIPAALHAKPWTYCLIPFLLLAMFLAILFRAHRVDVIHANWAICGVIASLAGWLVNKPVVVSLRGEDITRAQRGGLDRIILSQCVRSAAALIGVSDAMVVWLSENFPARREHIHCIKNGVPEDLLELGRDRRVRPRENITLLSIGSLIPRKCVNVAIEAVSTVVAEGLDDIRLQIAGSGPQEPALRRQVQDNGLGGYVAFLGDVLPSDLRNLYGTSDVLVLSSRSEGRPNVVLEAMAAGLAVLASDIDGVRELVEDGGTGLLFPTGDVRALAASLRRICEDRQSIERMGRAGHRFIIDNGLTWKRSAAQYLELYQRLTGNRLAGAS